MSSPEKPRSLTSPSAPLRGSLVELGLGVAWLIGVAAALQVVEALLGQSVLGAAIAGAVLVDLACSSAGVRWDVGGRRPWQETTRRLARGAAVAALLAAITLALSAAFGWARVGLGRPSLWLLPAALRAAAIGVRDELLFRGIPLMAAARAGVPPLVARGFAALTGAAAIALVPGTSPAAVALAAGSGLLFATLWQRDQGAFAAVGAHSALVLFTGALLRGGLLDATFARGSVITLGPRAAGAPAWLAAGTAVALAILLPRFPGFRSAGPLRPASDAPQDVAISPQK
jgi:hypothetical protein